jgi:hypothetical protein
MEIQEFGRRFPGLKVESAKKMRGNMLRKIHSSY